MSEPMRRLFVIISIACLVLFVRLINSESIRYAYIFGSSRSIVNPKDDFYYYIQNGTMDPYIEFKKYSGIHTICSINSTGAGSITVDYELEVDKGRYKVVLISPDNQITNIVSEPGSQTKEYQLKDGVSRIRLVGKYAYGKISMVIDPSDEVDITWHK